VDGDAPGDADGQAEVHEHGLVSGDGSQTTTGAITVSAPDGLQSVNVGGVNVSLADLENLGPGHTIDITTPDGSTRTLTGFTPGPDVGGVPTSGTIDYTYTLNGHQNQPGADGSMDAIPLTVTDQGGDTNTGTLQVHIVDDTPVANPDAAQVDESGTPN